jgi:hypothetical protein
MSMTIMLFSPFSEPLSTVFAFQAVPGLSTPLKFKKKTHRLSPKRSRPTSDVDHLPESKKKRRLRLLLITSRLSQPFSTPATHIVDPGTSKIAVWAKQRHLTQQVLRKAAIMNRVRRKTLERKDSGISVGEDERREAREAVRGEARERRADVLKEAVAAVGLGPNAVRQSNEQPRWSPPSSVLGLSNYDALDDEDDWYESYHEEEVSDPLPSPPLSAEMENSEDRRQQQKSYYSDWNYSAIQARRGEDEEDSSDDDDDPFHLNILSSEIVNEKRPPSPPEGRMAELIKEKERQREITAGFLHFA